MPGSYFTADDEMVVFTPFKVKANFDQTCPQKTGPSDDVFLKKNKTKKLSVAGMLKSKKKTIQELQNQIDLKIIMQALYPSLATI
jgi:hypothetical protein